MVLFWGAAGGAGVEGAVEEGFEVGEVGGGAAGATGVGGGADACGEFVVFGGAEPLGPVVDGAGWGEGGVEQGVSFQAAVGGCAGPGVVFGARDDAGAHGVALDVADCGPGVLFVEGAGFVAPLPEVPGAVMAAVVLHGVDGV